MWWEKERERTRTNGVSLKKGPQLIRSQAIHGSNWENEEVCGVITDEFRIEINPGVKRDSKNENENQLSESYDCVLRTFGIT